MQQKSKQAKGYPTNLNSIFLQDNSQYQFHPQNNQFSYHIGGAQAHAVPVASLPVQGQYMQAQQVSAPHNQWLYPCANQNQQNYIYANGVTQQFDRAEYHNNLDNTLKKNNINRLSTKGVNVLSAQKGSQYRSLNSSANKTSWKNRTQTQQKSTRNIINSTSLQTVNSGAQKMLNQKLSQNIKVSPEKYQLYYQVNLQNPRQKSSSQITTGHKNLSPDLKINKNNTHQQDSQQLCKSTQQKFLTQKYGNLQLQNMVLKSQISRLLAIVNQAKKDTQVIQKAKNSLAVVNMQIQHINRIKDQYQKLIQEKKQLQQEVQCLQTTNLELNAKVQKLQNLYQFVSQQKLQKDEMYKQATNQIEQLNRKIQKLKQSQESIFQTLLSQKTETSKILQSVSNYQQKLELMTKHKASLQERIQELEQQLLQKQMQLEKKQSYIKHIEEESSNVTKRKSKIDEELKRLRESDKNRKALEDELVKLKTQNKRLVEQINASPEKRLVEQQMMNYLIRYKAENKRLSEQLQSIKNTVNPMHKNLQNKSPISKIKMDLQSRSQKQSRTYEQQAGYNYFLDYVNLNKRSNTHHQQIDEMMDMHQSADNGSYNELDQH